MPPLPGRFLLAVFPRTVPRPTRSTTCCPATRDPRRGPGYELPLEEIVDRLSGRRICAQCKTVYHVTTRPARVEASATSAAVGSSRARTTAPLRSSPDAASPPTDDYGRDGRLPRVPATGTSEEILERSLKGLHERSPSGQT